MDADRAVNKRTLAVLFGLRFARAEYLFLVGGTYLALIVLVVFNVIPWTTLLALITLPEAYRLIQIVNTKTETPLLHQAQGRTARLHGRIGLLIVLGWLAYLTAQSLGL
jgi:1,4-dihydroxy-2-naphthoate octaprenyltransferase